MHMKKRCHFDNIWQLILVKAWPRSDYFTKTHESVSGQCGQAIHVFLDISIQAHYVKRWVCNHLFYQSQNLEFILLIITFSLEMLLSRNRPVLCCRRAVFWKKTSQHYCNYCLNSYFYHGVWLDWIFFNHIILVDQIYNMDVTEYFLELFSFSWHWVGLWSSVILNFVPHIVVNAECDALIYI